MLIMHPCSVQQILFHAISTSNHRKQCNNNRYVTDINRMYISKPVTICLFLGF